MLHLSIHFLLSIIAGAIVWSLWKKPIVSFMAAIFGGVLIDFDHFIDYYLAFRFGWNLDYFSRGYQFLQSGKIYVLFHGWEYVILLLLAAFFVRQQLVLKSLLLAVSIGMFFHLVFDVNVNDGMKIQSYSILYRMEKNFNNKDLVTQEHYQKFLLERKNAPFLNYK